MHRALGGRVPAPGTALAQAWGARGGCFLEPALTGAYTEHGAAEFRLPEPPWPGARSPRKLLLGPGPAEGRSGLTRCFGCPARGTKCCHSHRIPTWQRSDVIRKRQRRELHQYQRRQKQLVSW
ncbi:hypothetical protein GHT09_020469 [Marmota monax]|uniref:Uncharacterized protein n=1 Tax=Marmota monax TaxID=9995 RepID=A0A834US46_MARMO|nr:hypothetical protein GHT09_020469 [Marmota monax]